MFFFAGFSKPEVPCEKRQGIFAGGSVGFTFSATSRVSPVPDSHFSRHQQAQQNTFILQLPESQPGMASFVTRNGIFGSAFVQSLLLSASKLYYIALWMVIAAEDDSNDVAFADAVIHV